jgi:aspartate/methionine/tyrosine aminotransferase
LLLLIRASSSSSDPCQPHGETHILADGSCWGGGADRGCFSGFFGPMCTQYNGSALVDAHRNFFLIWQDQLEVPDFPSSPALPASWAMPYQTVDGAGVTVPNSNAVPPLEKTIRAVHKMAGNVDPDGKHLLLCSGARACLLAVLSALNTANAKKPLAAPLQVFARAPYWSLYPSMPAIASIGAQTDGRWNASADPNHGSTIEIFNYPNNPDGRGGSPLVKDKSRLICDMVFNWAWNHEAPVDKDCQITVFSMSKATGHAGSRVGWVFLSDPALFEAASIYTLMTSGGVSVEAQARTKTVLSSLLDSERLGFFAEARQKLEKRWDDLEGVLAACASSGVLVGDNRANRGPVLWITAKNASADTLAMLAAAGIDGEPGDRFGATAASARVNLVGSESSWALLLPRLGKLCHASDVPPPATAAAAERDAVWASDDAALAAARMRRAAPFVA